MELDYLILEDFFPNPDDVRARALERLGEDHSCILNDNVNNYPGIRSYLHEDVYEYICHRMSEHYDFDVLSGTYHITSRVHGMGLIHTDGTKIAAVIYLNPNPPPNSGTILTSPEQSLEHGDFCTASTTKDVAYIEKFASYKQEYRNKHTIYKSIDNVYNRCISYNGQKQAHAPDYYFGNNLYNSRLAITFWLQ